MIGGSGVVSRIGSSVEDRRLGRSLSGFFGVLGGAGARPAAQAGRDLRLDFFRGIALIFIFVDHVGSAMTLFTMQSFAFCDAAEVFVFISGYVAGLVYFGALERRGPLIAVALVYRRVWQLYVANIFVFVIYAALVTYVFAAAGDPAYTSEAGLDVFLSHPAPSIAQMLLLRFQPHFFDILPLYVVLLACFPFVLFLMRRHPLLPLAASIGLYLTAHQFGWSIDLYPGNDEWYFNPFDWQLIFVLGAVAWRMRSLGRSLLPDGRWLRIAAAVFVALCAIIAMTHSFHSHPKLHWFPVLVPSAPWHTDVDKSALSLLRLANFIALAYVASWAVRRDAAFLSNRVARAVLLCGQNSLHVFCAGILLSTIAAFILAAIAHPLWVQLLVTTGGVAIMMGTAALITWYKRTGRSLSARPAPAMAE
jgi:hypothetical protein